MVEALPWKQLEGKYWKPDNDKQYLVEFANWRIAEKTYGDSTSPRPTLMMDVLNITTDGVGVPEQVNFAPAKEFSTTNQSFIIAIRAIIDNAHAMGKRSVLVLLRKTGEGKKVTYSINDATTIAKYRGL